MESDTKPVVCFDRVDFFYDGYPVLEDVSFSVNAGDFVSILGPNGGGKTTLLKLMLGLLKPQTGIIKVFGGPPEKARSRIGYVPQYFQFDQKFPMRVIDVVLLGRLGKSGPSGPYKKIDREISMQALEKVEIPHLEHKPFSNLSGGQRQRALIARALAAEPEILVLDEPTSNVDMHGQNELLELLVKLSERITILFVTHDMGFVSSSVNKVICVNRKIYIHPTSEVTPELITKFFGNNISIVRHDRHIKDEGPV